MGMTMIVSKLCAIAAAAVLAAGLSGGALAQAPAGTTQGYTPSGNDANAAGPTGGTRALEVPVLYVTGIEIMHATLEPKIDVIRVTGLVSSAGWSGPTLVPFFYGKPADDILDLQFTATRPEQSHNAARFLPITADSTLEAGHPF